MKTLVSHVLWRPHNQQEHLDALALGNQSVLGNQVVLGNQLVLGNLEVLGNQVVLGNQAVAGKGVGPLMDRPVAWYLCLQGLVENHDQHL